LLQILAYVLLFVLCATVCLIAHSPTLRQWVLLTASYLLYLTWGPWFALVLLGSTVMNFFLGRWLERIHSAPVLWCGLLLNVAALSIFKYLPEAALRLPLSFLQPLSHLALPLGISFWTFQAMSYLFDLYRGEELNPTFTEFALYMAFFPVTISGPICRLPDMLPQFRSDQGTNWSAIASGFERIATGVFMMLLARLLGQGILAGDGITSGFDRATHWTALDVWCLAFGYGLELFLDFAGYSHIAIGAAQVLGFTVPENFERPFASPTPSIFWTRWHMSLSFWIRDYVFLPLALLHREVWWRNLALLIAMVIFGLWHKATVLLLLWGAYQGVILVLHRQIQQIQRQFDWNPPGKLWNVFSWLATIVLISLGWILFRSNSLAQARQMWATVFTHGAYASHLLSGSLYLLVAGLAIGYSLVLRLGDALAPISDDSIALRESNWAASLARWRWYWLPPLYAVALLFLLIVTFSNKPSAAQFMYRKF
jgi:D-alanyl-lipoteichoic acid acyltransferase DltB (MBOAT superfamily)